MANPVVNNVFPRVKMVLQFITLSSLDLQGLASPVFFSINMIAFTTFGTDSIRVLNSDIMSVMFETAILKSFIPTLLYVKVFGRGCKYLNYS